MARFTTNFMSETFGRPVTIDIVIPADHMVMPSKALPEMNRPYRTLYFMEGMCGNQSGPLNYADLQIIAEDYNMAVVCIGGENKWYSDSPLTGDNFIEHIAVDVVNFTRRAFHLSEKREDTYIGGFSMGGHGAFVIGLRHPEIFSRIVSLDASLQKYGITVSTDEEDRWDYTSKTQYMTMFGIKEPEEWVGSNLDYEYLAKALAESDKKDLMPAVFIACGKQDGLYEMNMAYRDMLKDLGYEVEWCDFDGMHSYYSMNQGLAAAVKWLPLENAFAENQPYYGPKANLGFDNFKGWRVFCNMEMEQKQ